MSHEHTECVYDFALSSISLRPVVSTAEHLAFPDVRRAAFRPGHGMIGVLRVELVALRALRAVDYRVGRSFHGWQFC